MHLVIVRDDFATFAHVHPDFDTQTGTFWQQFTKEAEPPLLRLCRHDAARHRATGLSLYAGEHGTAFARLTRLQPSRQEISQAGPYVVRLSKTTLPAKRARISTSPYSKAANRRTIWFHISAPRRTSSSLTPQPFRTSTSIRWCVVPRATHDSTMNMPMGDERQGRAVHAGALPPLPAGYYMVWIQLMGGGDNVYTAPFTILVR